MSTSTRKPGRREFLKQVPAGLAAGLAASQLAATPLAAASSDAAPLSPVGAAELAAPGLPDVTVSMLAAAQQVAGVDLPMPDLELARALVQRNLGNIQSLREVNLPAELEPAFAFRPPRPKRSTPPRRATRVDQKLPPRPASLDALAFESIERLGARIKARQVSSVELTHMYLDRLERADKTLICVVTLTRELALRQAAEADRELRAGRYRGPLHGIPYGIKDLFATQDILTTWGAKPYAGQVPDYDATAVIRMRDAGAVLIAKLATGELAVGDLWFRGRTRNPWNAERGSNGSSAGPASASAAGLVGFAIGTETGGSIMSPASTCGVVGLRPTYGRSSRFGCMTLRWTLDKVGVLARTAADTALVLEALHGPDGKDETVADLPFAWNGASTIRGLRLGYLAKEFAAAPPAQKKLYDDALDVFRKAGAVLVPMAMPDLPAQALYNLLNAEAGAMFDELVRTRAINEMADQGVSGRANQLRAARFIPAVDYIRAQRVRTLLLQQVNALFESSAPIFAFLAPSSSDSVTASNLTGHPAITVPAGFVDGLPIGLMITGPLYKEERILQVAAAFESATTWKDQHPKQFVRI